MILTISFVASHYFWSALTVSMQATTALCTPDKTVG